VQFEAYHSRLRLAGAGAIGALSFIFSIWVIFDPSWVENSRLVKAGMDLCVAAIILGVMLLGIGAFCAYICYKMIVHVGPVVRIDATGILWTAWSAKPIDWSNVNRILLGTETRTPYLKLYFNDPMIDLPDNDKMLVQANADRVSQRPHLYLSFFGLIADREQLQMVTHWYLQRRFEKGLG
jgi:hypothetical protein